MAHSLRVPHRCESALEQIFYDRNIFRSKWLKKLLIPPMPKASAPSRTPPSIMVTMVASS